MVDLGGRLSLWEAATVDLSATEPALLRPSALAKQMGVHVHTVYRMLERGDLVGVNIGRSLFIERTSWDAMLQRAREEAERRRKARANDGDQ